jgi:hypothetical protein
MAGGQRGIRLASGSEPAAVAINWTMAMGVRYPARPSARCHLIHPSRRACQAARRSFEPRRCTIWHSMRRCTTTWSRGADGPLDGVAAVRDPGDTAEWDV